VSVSLALGGALIATLAAGPAQAGTTAAAAPARRVTLTVEWGARTGPESLRAALAEELRDALATAKCFAGVGDLHAAPNAERRDDDLRLSVVIDDYHDETVFDYGAAALGSDDPTIEGRVVAAVEGRFHAAAHLGETLLREHRFRALGSWRPMAGEDARAEAERRLLEDAIRRVRRFACRGGAEKWRQQIEQARAGQPSGAR
jgi:hypothetical protein